jgi:hypothetical protein
MKVKDMMEIIESRVEFRWDDKHEMPLWWSQYDEVWATLGDTEDKDGYLTDAEMDESIVKRIGHNSVAVVLYIERPTVK